MNITRLICRLCGHRWSIGYGPCKQCGDYRKEHFSEHCVGDVIRVAWSNGAGYSDYRITDHPENGPHVLTLVQDVETLVAK